MEINTFYDSNSPSSLADLFNQNNETDRTLGEKFQNDMNPNNTKEDLQNAIKNCEPLRKLVYQNTTEWKIDEDYVNALCGSFKKNRERINAQQKALAFTATDVNTTNWYFHPIRFITYLNKVATPNPFNPYEGKVLIPRFVSGDDSTAITVKSCPGFAPLSSYLDEEKLPSMLQDNRNGGSYWGNLNYVAGWSQAYGAKIHTGVDFAGDKGMPIISMIRGVVWATTWDKSKQEGASSGYGQLMILKDLDKPLLYLIAHLSAYRKSEGDTFYPGETVALVGNTGKSSGAHLHLEVFKCEIMDKETVYEKSDDGELVWLKSFDRFSARVSPLDHSEHIK